MFNAQEQEIIKAGRAAGKTPDEISGAIRKYRTGYVPPQTAAPKTPTAIAEKVTDTLGLHNVVDTIGTDFANIAHPKLMEESGAPQPSIVDNMKAGAELGLVLPAPEAGGAALGLAKTSAKSAAKKVAKTAVELGKKVGDSMTPIEKGVETVLKSPSSPIDAARLSDKFSKYVGQAEKAVTDYSEATPLELAGQEGERALKALQIAKTTIAERKGAVTSVLGHLPVPELAPAARQALRDLTRERTGIVFKADQSIRKAAGRLSNVSDGADLKLLQQVDTKLAELEKAPTFRRADDAVDYIQDLLFKRSGMTAVPVNSKIEGALKSVIGTLNDGLKTVAKKAGNTDYEQLNTAYHEHAHTFEQLNKGLGLEGNKGAALMKQLFSPNGTLPRKLFAEIKDKTGIDLVEEATLAKFAMENIGDVRQASLLEQVLKGQVTPNSTGLIRVAADKILSKIKDPIGKAKRLIESSR